MPGLRHVRFRPEDAILLLIDHQEGTLDFVRNIGREGIVARTRALARTAAVLDLPVVLTSSLESEAQGPLIADLREIVPDAYERRVQRSGVADAWADPDFHAAVEAAAGSRRQVILAGVTNDVCTVAPAIGMTEDGYTVKVVQDAGGSISAMAEEVAVRTWERAGALTTTTGALIAELAVDWTTPRGRALAQITFEEVVANRDLP